MKTENQAIRDEAEADLSGLLYFFMLYIFIDITNGKSKMIVYIFRIIFP